MTGADKCSDGSDGSVVGNQDTRQRSRQEADTDNYEQARSQGRQQTQITRNKPGACKQTYTGYRHGICRVTLFRESGHNSKLYKALLSSE